MSAFDIYHCSVQGDNPLLIFRRELLRPYLVLRMSQWGHKFLRDLQPPTLLAGVVAVAPALVWPESNYRCTKP